MRAKDIRIELRRVAAKVGHASKLVQTSVDLSSPSAMDAAAGMLDEAFEELEVGKAHLAAWQPSDEDPQPDPDLATESPSD